MAINALTGTSKRLQTPQHSDDEIVAVRAAARAAPGRHVNLFGREYWADLDGSVYVVAWEEDGHVSGDPI